MSRNRTLSNPKQESIGSMIPRNMAVVVVHTLQSKYFI
jgi:hypothetical protein